MPKYSSIKWENGACHEMYTDLFYKVEEERNENAYLYINAVRSICGRCPIQRECLSYAFQYENYGVWGGLTTIERTAIAQPRKYPVQLKRAVLALHNFGITLAEVREIYEHSFDERSVENGSTDNRKNGAARNRRSRYR